jgi:hypothetical protein
MKPHEIAQSKLRLSDNAMQRLPCSLNGGEGAQLLMPSIASSKKGNMLCTTFLAENLPKTYLRKRENAGTLLGKKVIRPACIDQATLR